MTSSILPSQSRCNDRVAPLDKLAIIFFTFPLLAPAINETVIYPFLLAGPVLFISRRLGPREVGFLGAGAALLAPCAVTDPITALRLLSFYFSCIFFAYVAASPTRLGFLVSAGTVHAAIVVLQFLLLSVGLEVDFSVVLRTVYGPLLPGTGSHIDYNAFSQLDIFFPRVAGINREPAFATVLFLGLGMIAWRQGRRKAALLCALATLFSLSKVLFALLPSYVLLWWSLHRPSNRSVPAMAGRLLVVVASQVAFYLVIHKLSPLVGDLAALDASFYHRFIGHMTVADDPSAFNLLTSSWERLSRLSEFADYEFKDFRRGFFDGSVVAKLLLDFGWLPTVFYALAVSVLSRNWQAALALSLGGLFINLLSVSPATVITFMNLCALTYLRPSSRRTLQRRRAAISALAGASAVVQPATPLPKGSG
jgi:hypothetical protein